MRFSFFRPNICPRVKKEGGRIIASTAIRLRFFYFWTICRRVVIDASHQKVFATSRYFWVFRQRKMVPFSQVLDVTYGDQIAPDAEAATDQFNWFSVGLRMTDNSTMHLFHFIGEQTISKKSKRPSWISSDDYMAAVKNSDQTESRLYADAIARIIGVYVSVTSSRDY